MNLMISKIPLRHRSAAIAAMQADVAVDILSYVIGKSALGRMLVARSVDGVCAILIGADQDELKADLGCRFPQAILVANEAVVHDDLAKVIRFVGSPGGGLHLTLDMRGTPLQRRIWQQICAIPVGKTMSYMHLARLINNVYPKVAARLVANACAANAIALAVPCHRVIRTDGELAGYRWGIERKRDLIEKEALA